MGEEEQMDEIDIFKKMAEIEEVSKVSMFFGTDSEQADKLMKHRAWLQSIRREKPSMSHPYKIGVYIRYFNQTKYKNYLDCHKKMFEETIALYPKWTLVDLYIDTGSSAPNMESAPEWCRLLQDCEDGKVDLIITQKVSNVSKKPYEVTLLSRLLAAHNPPIGIYFISEDIFTLASYYQADMRDERFFPTSDWQLLPDEEPVRGEVDDR